jgi:predicted  nucleic acid-binding Zn-ribbon protein
MRSLRLLVPCAVLLAACDTQAKQQLATLAHTDSLRTDSLVSIKNDLLNEVMTSTQFVSAINDEMAKLKSKTPAKLAAAGATESQITDVKAQRAEVLGRIRAMVARLDSSEARIETLRARAATLSKHDATLAKQVEQYSRTIADLRGQVQAQKAEYEATIARQNTQIAALTSRVDTLDRANVQLAGEKVALADTVNTLTSEKNTAYYVVGTKDELIHRGILVEEGHRRLLLIGGRPVAPARELDPSMFTRIDRMQDRTINLPAGEFTIFSRQNPAYASPLQSKDGKISGGLRVDQPEKFWAPSRFLILVRG